MSLHSDMSPYCCVYYVMHMAHEVVNKYPLSSVSRDNMHQFTKLPARAVVSYKYKNSINCFNAWIREW